MEQRYWSYIKRFCKLFLMMGTSLAGAGAAALLFYYSCSVLKIFWLVLPGYFLIRLYHLSYQAGDEKKISTAYYRGENVLVIVPHMDDELNVAALPIRNYTRQNSTIRIAFTTNADIYGYPSLPKQRLRELERVCKKIGVPKENLIFMGYSARDGMRTEIIDKFFRDDELKEMTSFGISKTYSLKDYETFAKSWRGKEADNNKKSFFEDLTHLILEIRPTVIYCVDNDDHPDHIFLSRVFEEAFEKIVRTFHDYEPRIYKSFSYQMAWKGNKDFYKSINLLPVQENGNYKIGYQEWKDRRRVPYLYSADLGITLRSCWIWKVYSVYHSQNALSHMNALVNSDQVFFERRSDNLLKSAQIKTTSGNADKIKLFSEDFFLPQETAFYFDADDGEKEIIFFWQTQVEIEALRILYPLKKMEIHDVSVFAENRKEIILHAKGNKIEIRFPEIIQCKMLKIKFNSICIHGIQCFPARRLKKDFIKIAENKKDKPYLYEYFFRKNQLMECVLVNSLNDIFINLKRDFEIRIRDEDGDVGYEIANNSVIRFELNKSCIMECRSLGDHLIQDQVLFSKKTCAWFLKAKFYRGLECFLDYYMIRIRTKRYERKMSLFRKQSIKGEK